jgi:hypothetical protein
MLIISFQGWLKRTEAMILDLPQLKLCVCICGDGGNPATVFYVSPTDITKSLLRDFRQIVTTILKDSTR